MLCSKRSPTPASVLIAVVAVSACGAGAQARSRDAPASGRGQIAIIRLGCAACHEIPGIAGGHGRAGPALDRFGSQALIAGMLANTPANLVRWLQDPQSIAPGSAMPTLSIDSATAADIASYLRSMR